MMLGEWKEGSYGKDVFVAADGEILGEVSYSTFSREYTARVGMWQRTYYDRSSAKRAVERHLDPSSALSRSSSAGNETP